MSAREVLHQMRPFPLIWRRPVEDRPPYKVWALGSLAVWAVVLTIFDGTNHSLTVHDAVWNVFAGWCLGVIGASIAHYMYRR